MNSEGAFSYTENKHDFFEINWVPLRKKHKQKKSKHEQKEISLAVWESSHDY